ncbi:Bromodomain domain-containing protein [Cephalotus follicularis]|uniref:Bromodomain domain-containing protein n=1 Tax=Cephalotus follicularis TaxID=3775 RepID=A0A1Q3AU24_CEPFO|nr:Bromodomain domain-containing protein [Cephalotus follicularis]
MGAEVIGMWGTWEELLLGGAVLRHGTQDWNAIATELRTRTVCPFSFTPEVCKAKYEDVQQHYSGCLAWFEELRKQRMAELKRALELSEDSIGSLETKLENLKAEKGADCHVENDYSQTESPVPHQIYEVVEFSSKETSKDGLSAGSFTQETQTNWSPDCQNTATVASEDRESKPENLQSSNEEKVLIIEKHIEYIGQVASLKKRRGKRKRKDCSKDVKEGSVGESDFLGSVDLNASRCKGNSTSDSDQIAISSGVDDQCRYPIKDNIHDLMRVFDSIVRNDCASVFHCRHDSQKRGRYKKMILQHMDFDTIRSRFANRSITSANELFRDMLLIANNALVFYSKVTREHKSALLLRDLVSKALWLHLKGNGCKATTASLTSTSPMIKCPVKPRTVRLSNNKLSKKVGNSRNVVVARTSNGGKRPPNIESPSSAESLARTKKGYGRPRKAGHGTLVMGSKSTRIR